MQEERLVGTHAALPTGGEDEDNGDEDLIEITDLYGYTKGCIVSPMVALTVGTP